MMTKRGQAAGAAVLLAIIMGLIVVFILLIPGEERARLLGDDSISTNNVEDGESQAPPKKLIKEVLLKETPGHLSYLKETEIEKVLPPSRFFTQPKATILEETAYINVKKSVFSEQPQELYFEIDDLAHTENVLLDFAIEIHQGDLIILLNQQEIFHKETNKIKPLKLPKNLLTQENTLTFQASSPVLAFWRTNQYELQNVKVVADVTDVSAQESKHLFYVSPDENKNIEEVTLRFSLSCLPENKGTLEVKINNYLIFSGAPENCEDLFYYSLPPEIIKVGDNWLSFKTKKGDYETSHTAIKMELASPSHPTYYFELDEAYFTQVKGEDAACGVVDNICPDNCDEDDDKDCCFQEYVTPFWCDVQTENNGDRCVGKVNPEDCERCSSGYEEESGSPPEACEELCGDDTDNYCPSNCNSNRDQDCCFEQTSNQFWCHDLPTSGLDFTCLSSMSYDQCSLCPTDYEGEETTPDCPEEESELEEEKLKEDYNVILALEFTDDENKESEIYINGHKMSFDTYDVEFSRNINNYVEPWTNSIKIIPKSSFDIKELKVEIKS